MPLLRSAVLCFELACEMCSGIVQVAERGGLERDPALQDIAPKSGGVSAERSQ